YAQPLVWQGTLFVATAKNQVYGLDPEKGTIKWSRSLGAPLGNGEVACGDMGSDIGLAGTPVIDQATGIAYAFVKTHLNGGPSGPGGWYVHAIDVATGVEQPNFPVLVNGAASNDTSQVFAPQLESQRTGLLLMNGVIYAAFGSYCDNPPWLGWVVGV